MKKMKSEDDLRWTESRSSRRARVVLTPLILCNLKYMNDGFSYYTLGHFADVVPLFTVFKVDVCFYCLAHTHTWHRNVPHV